MKNLTWQNPEQLFVAQELINKVKSKCCGIKDKEIAGSFRLHSFLFKHIHRKYLSIVIVTYHFSDLSVL